MFPAYYSVIAVHKSPYVVYLVIAEGTGHHAMQARDAAAAQHATHQI